MQKIHHEENIKIVNKDYCYAEPYHSLRQKEKCAPLDTCFDVFLMGNFFRAL